MPRKITKKQTGVYEKEPGYGIWWIRFKSNGVTRREQIGRRGDAIAAYKERKTSILRLLAALLLLGSTVKWPQICDHRDRLRPIHVHGLEGCRQFAVWTVTGNPDVIGLDKSCR